ncbi:hypothetical protein SI65_08165 [Aspergillus cristatus]|uniref:Aminoglycoside phosphotransferase domain-containing protein n=1 Tax=Aspergillus cristatus TaxID=573508 RepID=A0A1E3B6Y9_ASPCR|nr:hypothetical protein SI65_08165 [Aspergillus cristatus]
MSNSICSNLLTLQSMSAMELGIGPKVSGGLTQQGIHLDNGQWNRSFAKLPNPNAGPAQYSTASEVATHKLLRDVFNIPAPRILAWSSNAANNHVEAEYIIAKKAPGIRLGSLWHQWPREAKLKLIRQVVDLENTLTSITFPKHGCIYFKEDLRPLTGDAEDLNIDSAPEIAGRFSIGPLTSADLWTGTRKGMELDRGPWRDSGEYTKALGHNEMAWIKLHASPRMNYYRSSQEHELSDDSLALLTQYMDVASYLVP